ncbi:MAG: hypothetical protein ACO4BW_06440, partial [Nitriliruptoraceae bacterium]
LLADDGAEALRARLTDGLVAALRTPLDQVAPALRLCALAPRDRLSEPPFELPITDTAAPVEVAALADAVARELPAGPVRTLLEGLAADPRGPRIAGWLTGVADLVVRLPDGRYAVLDHKTNRLVFRPAGTTEERQRYDQPMMEHVACRDHYVLQGLLYLVALHRWLDRRLDGYDPAHHLGGFGLLFLRGMPPASAPAATGARPGVWWGRPPAAAIVAADRVRGGGGPA